MIKLIYAVMVGALVLWAIDTFPDFLGYLLVGFVTLFIIKSLKSK